MDIANYLERLKKFYGEHDFKVKGLTLRKFLENNPDISCWLESELSEHSNLLTISNMIYYLVRDISLDSLKCKTCGKPLIIRAATQAPQYCSPTCAHMDIDVINKTKNTIMRDPDFYKKRQKKTLKTNMERYGVAVPTQLTFGKRIAGRTANSGTKSPTVGDLFGMSNRVQKISLSDDNIWDVINSWSNYILPQFEHDELDNTDPEKIYTWKCVKCGNVFQQKFPDLSNMYSCMPRCLSCYPIGQSSKKEVELIDYIKSIVPDEVLVNDDKLIAPDTLDIVIPSKKLAIELNGDYWHAEKYGQERNYHLNKTLKCEALGYKLIHIWENDWNSRAWTVKDKIRALCGIGYQTVYARKCEIRDITNKQKAAFLDKYHIQGNDKGSIKFGLFDKDELVAVMTWGKPRFNTKYEYELIRYATSKHVVGGAGKLLRYFEERFKPKSMITYADRSYSQGNLYRKLGFNDIIFSEPNYHWMGHGLFLTRYQCQKHKLHKILGDRFNPEKTETQNMSENGFLKVFDCGNLVFEKQYPQNNIEEVKENTNEN